MRNCGGRWLRGTAPKKWLGCTDAYSNTVTVATTRPWPTALVRLGTGFNGKKLAEPVSAPPTNPTRSRERPAHWGERSGQPEQAERATPANHSWAAAAEPPGSQHSGSEAEAQWAVAAALERPADVIVAALHPAEATGRHAAGRAKRS